MRADPLAPESDRSASDALFFDGGARIAERRFVALAVDPAASVVIDACAGSGKTTLLVRRIIRALLAGEEPSAILAITFTRAAAQEMQVRVRSMLRRLALADDASLAAMLRDELMVDGPADATGARLLYERVLNDPRGLQITTFHSWFWSLLQAGGDWSRTNALSLADGEAELLEEAWRGWLDGLDKADGAPLAAAFAELVRRLGAVATERLMRSFVGQRNEWLAHVNALAGPRAATAFGPDLPVAELVGLAHARQLADWSEALARLLSPGHGGRTAGAAPAPDLAPEPVAGSAAGSAAGTAQGLRSRAVAMMAAIVRNADLEAELRFFAGLFADAGKKASAVGEVLAGAVAGLPDLRAAAALAEQAPAADAEDGAEDHAEDGAEDDAEGNAEGDERRDAWVEAVRDWLGALQRGLHRGDGKPLAVPWHVAALQAKLRAAGDASAIVARWDACVARIGALRDLDGDLAESLPMNLALLHCAVSLTLRYQSLKRERGLIDFVDLESEAARSLADPLRAAYLEVKLDRRYRQLLFDEFQDTSSLQWSFIGGWLAGYGGAGSRPGVFIVGDPKQSIYRFRRAEPRVFAAAATLLQQTFDARLLRTSTTRRNSPLLVERLNACLDGEMPGYATQATLAPASRSLFDVLAPVARAGTTGRDSPGPGAGHPDAADPDAVDPGAVDPGAAAADAAPPGTAGPGSHPWLVSPRMDEEGARYAEGRQIGEAIERARHALGRDGRPLPYGEVMILARSRRGFADYERALRSLGIPVQSDRRGGLLEALEVQDLLALLRFSRDPADDLALAQLLRSPLLGLPAGRIGALSAARGDGSLFAAWRRDCPAAERPLLQRLETWIAADAWLPTHDFLDAVVSTPGVAAGYAQCVAPRERGVVTGNLDALIGFALDHDGGRYPSSAGFLARLRTLARLADGDTPDEGRPVGLDAVRIMTVHASKGLEADLVVVADSAGRVRGDGARFCIDWPPQDRAPRSAWFRLDRSRRGHLSAQVDAREGALAAVEDWNLLYVASTRARRGLVVTAAPSLRAGGGSRWFERLRRGAVAAGDTEPDAAVAAAVADRADRVAAQPAATPAPAAPTPIAGFYPPPLSIGRRVPNGDRMPPLPGGDPIRPAVADRQASAAGDGDDDAAMAAGRLLHAALEWLGRGTPAAALPMRLAGLASDRRTIDRAIALAERVRAIAGLEPAFRSTQAIDEGEYFDADGNLIRIDRLCRVGDDLWVIDYKWSIAEAHRAQYREQLDRYRGAVAALDPRPFGAGGVVRAVLVDAVAGTVRFDPH